MPMKKPDRTDRSGEFEAGLANAYREDARESEALNRQWQMVDAVFTE